MRAKLAVKESREKETKQRPRAMIKDNVLNKYTNFVFHSLLLWSHENKIIGALMKNSIRYIGITNWNVTHFETNSIVKRRKKNNGLNPFFKSSKSFHTKQYLHFLFIRFFFLFKFLVNCIRELLCEFNSLNYFVVVIFLWNFSIQFFFYIQIYAKFTHSFAWKQIILSYTMWEGKKCFDNSFWRWTK